jgi:pimeloyl-ACP methyl ester carboxylesterase
MLVELAYPLLWLWACGHQRYNRVMARLGRKPAAVTRVQILPETHYRKLCDRLRRLDMALWWRISPARLARLVIDLFETPLRTQGKLSERIFLDGLQCKWLPFAGGRVPVYLGGPIHAPAILLVHGWEGRAGMLQPLCQPLLDTGYRVIIPDLYAHGRAHGRRVSFFALAHQLRLVAGRFGPVRCLIGHSSGGLVAALALQQGLVTGGLVTIGTPFSLRRLLERHFALCRLSPEQQAWCSRHYLGRHRLNPAALEASAFAGLSQPWLLCHDRYDQMIPLGEAEDMLAQAPRARLCLTHGGGHLGVLRNPHLLRQIMAFADGGGA